MQGKPFRIGIIGAGGRVSWLLKDMKFLQYPYEITGCLDIDFDHARKNMENCGLEIGKTVYSDCPESFFGQAYDGVVIGTRCNLHTPYALEVMKRNLPMFLEKPVCISYEQFYALREAAKTYQAKSVVSFPLRYTALVQKVRRIVESGRLGKISQVQAYNNVTYGRVYYKYWYRDEHLIGNMFVQKATHDVDYINYLLGKQPVEVCAMDSKVIFRGNKEAGKSCRDCEERETCDESLYRIETEYDDVDPHGGNGCSYAVDTGNQDSGTLIMRYADGMHAVYTQNFVARKKAGRRGCRIIGQSGTVEFDFYSSEVVFFDHHSGEVERTKIDESKFGHSGGDLVLLKEFARAMKDEPIDNSVREGLRSVAVCLAAEQSARNKIFVPVEPVE